MSVVLKIVNTCVLLVLFAPFMNGSEDVIVETSSGKVKGKSLKTIFQKKSYVSFFGIPYAEPPIGQLRFEAPKPHPSWNDVLEAVKLPKPCSQYYHPVRHRTHYGYFGFEDCLYLSISTPQTTEPKSDLPVIVFLINEQFKNSLNSTKKYFPDFFIEEDIIIVNVNHRLSSLGFLSTGDDLIPGNNGLRDIILGLEWIKANIKLFGGDPEKVTLLGSFGGAVAVDLLLHSKKAKGLFSAAILQSGSSWSASYLNDHLEHTVYKLAELLELQGDTAAELLRQLKAVEDPKLLVENDMAIIEPDKSRTIQRGIVAFSPVVEHEHEDAIITSKPEEEAFIIDIPIIVGFNSREGIDLTSRFLNKPEFLTYFEKDFPYVFPIRKTYRFELRDDLYYEAIQEIKDFYFENGTVKVSKPGEYITYSGDIFQTYPIDYMVRKYVNSSSKPIYYYNFDYSSDLNENKWEVLNTAKTWDGAWGANIGDELCYLFVCNTLRKKYKKINEDNPEAGELKVMRRMVRLWSNFARTRNPTPEENDDVLQGFTWAPTTSEKKNYLLIQEELQMKLNPIHGRIRFWDKFLEKYEKLAVDGVVKTVHDEL